MQQNTTDIKWMKETMNEIKQSMRNQTAILFGLFVSVIVSLITILIQGV